MRLLVFILLPAVLAGGRSDSGREALGRGHPLRTAIVDPEGFSGTEAPLIMKKTRESGATVVRLILDWRGVAPAQPLPGFNPANPEDAAYNWSGPDRQVRLATE